MHEGRIQQWDTPYNLYHEPANRFVADFVGQGALVSGEVINDHQVEIELGVLNGHIPVDCDASGCDECVRSCQVDVLLRPDDIVHDDDSLLLAEVENKAFRGAEFLYTLKLPERPARAVAGALAPQSRHRREDRHQAGGRSRRGVSPRVTPMLPPPLRGLLFNVGLGFTVALLLMLAVIGLGVTQMAHLNTELENVVSINNVKTRLASQMRDAIRDRQMLMHNIVVSIDPWEKDTLFLQFQEYGERYSKDRRQLGTMLSTPDEKH